MAKILIPTPLRQFAGKHDAVEVAGTTVGEALGALTGEYPDLRKHLYNDEGKLRSFVNVYVNDEDIRYLGKEATPLQDSDTISIVPSIAGGLGLRPRDSVPPLADARGSESVPSRDRKGAGLAVKALTAAEPPADRRKRLSHGGN